MRFVNLFVMPPKAAFVVGFDKVGTKRNSWFCPPSEALNYLSKKIQMFDDYKFTVAKRFMRYVQVDTQSDPNSNTQPSTEKQKNLSKILVTELKQLGITDAALDEFGYVYATIPSNTTKKVPVICFCAHVDTSPDSSGANVKPIVHKKYDGNDIVLPDDPSIVISTNEHPYLKKRIGDDIITASGTTLLGADDKAGVAVIMDMANFLLAHPKIKHGDIKILFTPDEEILVSHSADETMIYLEEISELDRRRLGYRARERVLARHTTRHRAAELESYALEVLKLSVA